MSTGMQGLMQQQAQARPQGGGMDDTVVPLDYNQPLTKGDLANAQSQQAGRIFGPQQGQAGGGDMTARINAIRQLLGSQGGGGQGGPTGVRRQAQPLMGV